MRFFILLSAVLVLLAGCAGPSVLYEPTSTLFGAGATMELHRDLEIPADRTRVFFQRGKLLTGGRFDQYYPSCDLEVRALRSEAQRVEKDQFFVTRVEYGQEAVALLEGGAVQVAALGIGIGSGGGLLWDRGESIFRYVRIWLHSERQPDVMRLTCRGAWEDYFRASPPNDVEIRIALGEIITFDDASRPDTDR